VAPEKLEHRGLGRDRVQGRRGRADRRWPRPAAWEAITQDWFLGLAQGNYDGTKNRREGIVVRPICNVESPALRASGLVNLETESTRLTFKVLNNSFLLKDED